MRQSSALKVRSDMLGSDGTGMVNDGSSEGRLRGVVPAKGHLVVVEGRATLVGACGMRRDSLL